jgi:hypothetical protein
MLRGLPLSNELGCDLRTRAIPLLVPLPRAPPVSRALADRSRSVLPALLPMAPPAILYDAFA